MPRVPKRRSDAIARDDDEEQSEGDSSPPPRRRQRSTTASANVSDADENSDGEPTQTQSQATTQSLIKKLVRLALSVEYSRTPLRRNDINAKIMKDSGGSRNFKAVFAGAQEVLQNVFGMQLVDLPSREKTGLNERRKAAATQQATQQADLRSQTQTAGSTKGAQSWILVSILPSTYKTNPSISRPTLASSAETEAIYTSLYTFILSLIYLNNGSIPEAKLERHLRRVNLEQWTPLGGTLEKLLQRMSKEGYVEKRRDTSGGEDVIEWVVGPRGKVEVGVKGVAGLVRSVYGLGAVPLEMENDDDVEEGEHNGANGEESRQTRRLVKIDQGELEKKLKRSLGVDVLFEDRGQEADRQNVEQRPGEDAAEEEPLNRREAQSAQVRRPTRRTRRANEDEDDGF